MTTSYPYGPPSCRWEAMASAFNTTCLLPPPSPPVDMVRTPQIPTMSPAHPSRHKPLRPSIHRRSFLFISDSILSFSCSEQEQQRTTFLGHNCPIYHLTASHITAHISPHGVPGTRASAQVTAHPTSVTVPTPSAATEAVHHGVQRPLLEHPRNFEHQQQHANSQKGGSQHFVKPEQRR